MQIVQSLIAIYEGRVKLHLQGKTASLQDASLTLGSSYDHYSLPGASYVNIAGDYVEITPKSMQCSWDHLNQIK